MAVLDSTPMAVQVSWLIARGHKLGLSTGIAGLYSLEHEGQNAWDYGDPVCDVMHFRLSVTCTQK